MKKESFYFFNFIQTIYNLFFIYSIFSFQLIMKIQLKHILPYTILTSHIIEMREGANIHDLNEEILKIFKIPIADQIIKIRKRSDENKLVILFRNNYFKK
jgi:hypothetical protein